MNKKVTAVICVLLAIWFFFMGFELGIYKERKSASNPTTDVVTVPTVPTAGSTTETTLPPQTTTAPTTNPTETQSSTTGNQTTGQAPTESTTKKDADPSSMSTDEVISEMEKAFKKVKSEQNMTAVKNEEISIQLTDLSVSSLMNMVNRVIQGLAGAEQMTYTFQNGTATAVDGDGKAVDGTFTMDGILPPDNKEWKCDPAGIASAKAAKNNDGTTTYEVKLKPEDTTFTEPVPAYTSGIYGYLDLTTLDIPGVTITDAKMHYDGTTVTVIVDGSGRVKSIHYNMPMNGYGEAKITFASGNASFEGYDDEVWTFTY